MTGSFMVTAPKKVGGGMSSTNQSASAPTKPKTQSTKKVAKKKPGKVKPTVSLLTTRPKNSKSQQLQQARSNANNYALDLDRIARDVERGTLKIDPRAVESPQNANDQRQVLLRQAAKLARLSKQLELRIFNDKNNKLIYALLNVYQQQSDVVDQIVKISDLGGRAERVVDKLIDPFAKEVTTALVGLVHSLGESLHGVVKDEETAKLRSILVAEVRKVGGELQKSRNDMVARVPHILMDE